MNLPNTLTLGRIFLIPLLVVVLLTNFEGRTILGIRKELIGTIIFLLAACTDWLDGFVARRRGQVTELGQLMDPLADKLLITAAFVSLVALELAPAWIVAIILGRELGVTVLRSIAYSKGITIVASPLGKLKMVSEVVAIVFLILGREYLQEFFVLGQIALWVVLVAALRFLKHAFSIRLNASSMPQALLSIVYQSEFQALLSSSASAPNKHFARIHQLID